MLPLACDAGPVEQVAALEHCNFDRPQRLALVTQHADSFPGLPGPVMTGLGPSLRRLSSEASKASQGAAGAGADGKLEGGSDAGDSADGLHASGEPCCHMTAHHVGPTGQFPGRVQKCILLATLCCFGLTSWLLMVEAAASQGCHYCP